MQILIIGGTKFIGYHITKRLLENGYKLSVFNRGKTPDEFGDRIEHYQGDRRDNDRFFQTFKNKYFDAVIDVIGYRSENVETAIKVFSGNVGHYIFISSGQVYLITENRHIPSKEEDFYQPLTRCPPGEEDAWFYGVEKRECELALLKAYESEGFPMTILRLPIVHGEYDYTLRAYSYFLRISDGGPLIVPDGGNTVIRHIWAGDVAQTVAQIVGLKETCGQVYNLAQKEVLNLKGFLKLCAKLIKRRVKLVSVSSEELINRGLDLSFSPFSSQWISYLDITKAINELNFCPTPIGKWLKRTIDWFFKKYHGEKPANYILRPHELEIASSLLKES